jgi:hypothetical protein
MIICPRWQEIKESKDLVIYWNLGQSVLFFQFRPDHKEQTNVFLLFTNNIAGQFL